MCENNAIFKQATKYEKDMVRFLRELVAIPSESCDEGKVITRIKQEMKKVGGFDRIYTDRMGNLFGQIGKGNTLIAIDAHVDTVGIGNPDEWKHDPFEGKVRNGTVYGRGAGDQEGAIASMVYAGRIIKDLKLRSQDWSLLMAFTVMEEDCDGLCWQYIIKEGKLHPDCVVVTDSTNCNILRGQRGRMEISVRTLGKSCHGAMPEKGENAVYKISKIIREIEALNKKLKTDKFLGKGTITVTGVDSKSPSQCAVPNEAHIHIDRRLTAGETKTSALKEIKAAVKRAGVDAKVEVLQYAADSYTGLHCESEKYFPTWVVPERALQVQAAVQAYKALFDDKPKVHRWTFSTNAVAINGMFGIPCVGFGPASEEVAHTVNDSVPIEHLVKCAAFYAAFPTYYSNGKNGKPGKR